MSRAWSSLAVASLVGVLVGCGADVGDVEPIAETDGAQAAQTEQNPCDTFKPYQAGLGAVTLACRGTIAVDQYVVRRSLSLRTVGTTTLARNFKDCPADPDNTERLLQDIDDILGLQSPAVAKEMPGAAACFISSWTAWQKGMSGDGIRTCPDFKKVESYNVASLDAPWDEDPMDNQYNSEYSTLQYAELLPDLPAWKEGEKEPPKGVEVSTEKYWRGKSHAFYDVRFPFDKNPNDGCQDALSCANRCGEAFPGFVMPTVKNEKYFVGDPSWWVANEYAPGSNPYMVPGFYHPMSFEAPLPMGVVYGHRARVGEACSKWAGGFSHYVLGLSLYCFSPSLCYAKCSGPAPVVYSDGVAF